MCVCVCVCVSVTSAGLVDIGQLHRLQSLSLRDNRQLTDDVLLNISHGCMQLTYVTYTLLSHVITCGHVTSVIT